MMSLCGKAPPNRKGNKMNNEQAKAQVVETIKGRPVFSLACDADCGSPDSLTSPGVELLESVASGVAELIEGTDADEFAEMVENESLQDLDYSGSVHEIADGAPDVYTSQLWAEFQDLAAYNEDPVGEFGPMEGADMSKLAAVSLYIIANRLAWSLIEQAGEEFAELTEDEDDEAEAV